MTFTGLPTIGLPRWMRSGARKMSVAGGAVCAAVREVPTIMTRQNPENLINLLIRSLHLE
ncbi:MAG: hypothetical protein DMD26_04760 [Gemmatimonadetes bacterium]|nr:MAG: hypothetical protein DMD26_04760 [Gemmatimonadota bacterium]